MEHDSFAGSSTSVHSSSFASNEELQMQINELVRRGKQTHKMQEKEQQQRMQMEMEVGRLQGHEENANRRLVVALEKSQSLGLIAADALEESPIHQLYECRLQEQVQIVADLTRHKRNALLLGGALGCWSNVKYLIEALSKRCVMRSA